MIKTYAFYKEYKNFEKHGSDGRMIVTSVESDGDTLEELYANATVGLEDWNGNELPFIKLDDMAEQDRIQISLDVRNIYLKQKLQDSVGGKKSW
jgi:hypothetical protein